jgi:hypothetical protein
MVNSELLGTRTMRDGKKDETQRWTSGICER